MHERTAVEEHITLIKEPQSEYIGHFAASTRSSQPLFNVLVSFSKFHSYHDIYLCEFV